MLRHIRKLIQTRTETTSEDQRYFDGNNTWMAILKIYLRQTAFVSLLAISKVTRYAEIVFEEIVLTILLIYSSSSQKD